MADETENRVLQDEQNTDTNSAEAKVHEADVRAQEARAKADDAGKSDEQRDAERAEADASRARSEAAEEAAREGGPQEPDTVASARVAAPVEADMSAGHHLAQKFGNDPANPKPARHIPDDYDGPTTRMSRITPDKADPVAIDVHPDMVGDYLRAGWSLF